MNGAASHAGRRLREDFPGHGWQVDTDLSDIYKIEAFRRSVSDIEAAALAESLKVEIGELIVMGKGRSENE